MPLGYGKTFFDPKVNWMYRAEPDPGLAGNVDHWPRGRVLGGSSSINAMVWVRGARADFDDWRDAGNPGWGADDMFAAFRNVECAVIGDEALRGRKGPLNLFVPSKTTHDLTRKWFESAQAIGLPLNPDFNGASQEGVGQFEFTIHGGRRLSAARAFLRPAMKRANLRVITNAHVTGLTFEGTRVTGVTYDRGGRTVTVRAGREVILSGGSVNSPQLLQLSGIGPADHLRSLGLEVRVDNPNVGRNLEDHIGINYTFRAKLPDHQPATRSLVGQAERRPALYPAARRTAVGQPQPGRRLHPQRAGTPRGRTSSSISRPSPPSSRAPANARS